MASYAIETYRDRRYIVPQEEIATLSEPSAVVLPIADGQLAVLSCLAQGLSYEEFAPRLGIEVTSARENGSIAIRRLRAIDAREAIMYAIAVGVSPTILIPDNYKWDERGELHEEQLKLLSYVSLHSGYTQPEIAKNYGDGKTSLSTLKAQLYAICDKLGTPNIDMASSIYLVSQLAGNIDLLQPGSIQDQVSVARWQAHINIPPPVTTDRRWRI